MSPKASLVGLTDEANVQSAQSGRMSEDFVGQESESDVPTVVHQIILAGRQMPRGFFNRVVLSGYISTSLSHFHTVIGISIRKKVNTGSFHLKLSRRVHQRSSAKRICFILNRSPTRGRNTASLALAMLET